MPLLAATGPARRLAQALDPWWLFQPIARWRLAAVGTVQSEPALEFGDACPERRDLGRLRCYQRNQLFPRWLGPRIKFRIHRILESKPDSAVQKNLQSTGLPTPAHLGSYWEFRVRQGRRVDLLRIRPAGHLSSRRDLCRSHSSRREAGRSPGAAPDKI